MLSVVSGRGILCGPFERQGAGRFFHRGIRLQVWRMSCAGFRHAAGFHARVILDGAACRPGDPGEVHDVLGVLGVDRVVPIVVRVLVSWWREE